MARYSGKTGIVYIASTVGGAAASIVGLSKWSLDETTDKQECTAFGDLNKVYVQGLPDKKGMVSGFWDNVASDTLFSAAAATGAVNMYLYPSTLTTTKYWYGTAFFDDTVEADVKDAVKVTANFHAGGSWGRF